LTVSPIELIKKIGSALFGPGHPETAEEVLPEEELEEAVPESVQEIPSEPPAEAVFESEEPEEPENRKNRKNRFSRRTSFPCPRNPWLSSRPRTNRSFLLSGRERKCGLFP